MRKSFCSILFVLTVMFSVSSMQANAATVKNVKDYLPSVGFQYEMSNSMPGSYAGGTKLSTSCLDSNVADYNSRYCDIKSGLGGVTYYYNKSNWRLSLSGTDAYITENYSFPMTAGKKYNKTVEGQYGDYSYTYTVESVNSKVKVGNKKYTNVIKIKNEKGGYTYIAKHHGAIFISTKRNGKSVIDFKVTDYKKIATASTKKYTTTAAVNVRTGAGKKYKTIGVLNKGEAVTVKGSSDYWYKISYKGKTGYVSKYYVKVAAVAQKPTTAATVTTKKYTTTAAVNVRKGTSTKYKSLGVLKKGATMTVKGTTNGWYKVSYKGKTGYVAKSYVKVTTVAKKPATTTATTKKYKTTAAVNVRKGTSTKYKALGTLKKGATVTVKGTSGGWYKVSYKGKTGYVAKSYVKVTTVAKKPATTTATAKKYKTTAAVNVRTGASTKYKSLGVLKKGTAVTVKGTSGSWYKISYKGKTGYVTKSYVKVTKVTTVVKKTEQLKVASYYETTDELNIRKGAGTSFQLLDILKNGATVKVIGQSGLWSKISYDGKTGYVSTKYLATPARKIDSSLSANLKKEYKAGEYTVGETIPEGEYKLYSMDNSMANLTLNGANGKRVVKDSFRNTNYITVEKGMKLDLENAYAVPIQYATSERSVVGDEMSGPGTYKIGFDLTPGKYTIYSAKGRDAFVSKSSRANSIRTAPVSRFQGKDFLTLEKGSYIRLDHGFLQYTGAK